MSELCEHETFKDVCGICHRDGMIASLRAENERLGRDYETARNAHDNLLLHNERLKAALTPSAKTKAAYIGEFHFTEESYTDDGEVYYRKIAVPWTTVKEIMAAISALAAQPAPSEWRPIDTAPKDGSRMLLAYRNSLGKWRRVIAFYAPKLAIEGNDYGDDWCEYDEASDRYFLPEGWYECVENWEDYSSVHMSGIKPTHWRHLPPAPGKEEA